MNKGLGVWTYEDTALVLIDYQNEMFEVIRSETDAALVELHVRLLAKTAKALDMPIVLSTVGVGFGFNGPTLPSVLAELEGIEPIDRTSMNASGDLALRRAVQRAYGFDHPPTEDEMVQLAERWRPYRSLAVSYLFAYEF